MTSPVQLLTSFATTGLRAGRGIASKTAPRKPIKLLQLYDMEGCPYCRLAREALTELDLDAQIFPCPKGGTRFRPEVVLEGGKAQFPYLVDPNTGTALYESIDIITYLYDTYGDQALPLRWRLAALQKLGSAIAGAARGTRGLHARTSASLPETSLELYSFEASPYARPVRELLCELEIPYVLRSCGRSRLAEWVPPGIREPLNIAPDSVLENRLELQKRAGKVSIPYLEDPNTDEQLFESGAIVSYLNEQYA